MVAQVDAAVGARGARAPPARPAGRRAAADGRRRRARPPSSSGAGGAPATAGSRRVAEAYLATARAYQRRLEGDDDPAVWARVADAWDGARAPYEVALARWRQAEAILGSGAGRAGRARRPRRPCSRRSRSRSSSRRKPLLRELRELAGRARIQLPDEVEAFLAEPVRRPRRAARAVARRPSPRRRRRSRTADPTSCRPSPAIRTGARPAATRSA